jgi:hypothetical protein
MHVIAPQKINGFVEWPSPASNCSIRYSKRIAQKFVGEI